MLQKPSTEAFHPIIAGVAAGKRRSQFVDGPRHHHEAVDLLVGAPRGLFG
jgi:hypothetical protein